MKLGLSSYTYTWAIGVPGYPPDKPLSALGLLEKAVELDVAVVQIVDNLPLGILNEAGLQALEQYAMFGGIQLEVGTRGIQPDHLRTYLRLARRFHSPILRVVIDTANHHPSIKEAIDLLRISLPAFVDAGITLAIENHDRFSTKEFVHLLEAINSPFIGICLDTVNSFGALEGPQVVVKALAPWTVNLHIKDFLIRRADHMMGFTLEGTPAGQGRLDIPWLLERLKSYGRDFNAILELWTSPESDLSATIEKEDVWARESVRFLRKCIKQ
jgi:sugar phosphate isomerase/epimerase